MASRTSKSTKQAAKSQQNAYSDLEATTLNVSLGTSRFGLPEPQILVRVPRSAPRRQLSVALHRLAADIEAATPDRERWLVNISIGDDDRDGRVYLELMDANDAEAERGLAVLRSFGR
jgi:hypothetical protein